MAISFIQFTGGGQSSGPSISKAFTSNVTANSTLIVTALGDSGNTFTVSDNLNAGNYDTDATGLLPVDGDGLGVFSFKKSAAGACTVTVASTGNIYTIVIHEFAVDASGAVLDKTSQGYNAGSTSQASGSTATTTAAAELVFGAAMSANAAPTYSAAGGATLMSNGVIGATNVGTGTEYQIVAATGAQSSSFTTLASTEWRCFCLTYKAASGGTNLTGQTVTSSEGTVSRAVTYGLTGQTATFTEGTITSSAGSNVTKSLTGQTSTFTSGTISLNLGYSLNDGVPLTGQTASFTEGTPTNSVTYSLTGQTVTLTEGALASLTTYGLTGQTGTFTEGSISSSVGGNVTLSLTGQTVTLTEGTITTLSGYSLTGQTGTLSEGTIANGGLVIALTGQTIQGISGTVTQSGGTSLGAPPMYMAGFVSNISTFMAHNQT